MSDNGWHVVGWGFTIGTIAFLMAAMPGQISRDDGPEPTQAPVTSAPEPEATRTSDTADGSPARRATPARTRSTSDAPGAAPAPGQQATRRLNAAGSGPAYADGSAATGRLAASNIGKSAGECADEPTTNSVGGSDFQGSCPDGADGPENWAADFATWVWRQRGYATNGLDATASSFVSYADRHASLRSAPKPGDAIVFAEGRFDEPSHVAIVTRITENGDIELANGNWGADPSTDVAQARASKVERTVIPANQARVGGGAIAAQGGQQIVAIVAPAR